MALTYADVRVEVCLGCGQTQFVGGDVEFRNLCKLCATTGELYRHAESAPGSTGTTGTISRTG